MPWIMARRSGWRTRCCDGPRSVRRSIPGQETLAQAAAIMGARLGWSDERRAAEIAAVDEIFAVTAP